MTPAAQWRDTLRQSLLSARKNRDTGTVSALRSALSAIDNAETPDHGDLDVASGPIAGAVTGVGAAEVARRELSDADIRGLIQAEIDERLTAAGQYVSGGHHERAAELRTQVAVLRQLLDGF
ncbi:glutamyl-tRNA amidotransferase [Mycobacterium sp. NPDC003449]